MNTPEIVDPSIEQARSAETLYLYNSIQTALIERYANLRAKDGIDQTTASLEWTDKNSGDFRELVKIKPDILERYESEPDAVLAEIENALQ